MIPSGPRPRSARQGSFLAGLLATVALVSAACGSASTSAASSTNRTAVHLKVGETGWFVNKSALDLAGLSNTPYTVDWSLFQGGDQQLQALKAGAIDVASSSEIPPIFAAAGGTPNFKVVAVERANTLLQQLVVPQGSALSTVADLKGKKVGYVKNTTAQYFLVKMLQQAGLSWSDIQAAPLSTSDGLAALTSGAVDALASYGNAIISAHAGGARTLASAENILSGNFLWSAHDVTLSDPGKRAAVVDLLDRINRAFAYVRSHLEQFAALTASNTKEPVGQALSTRRNGEQQRPTTIGPTSQEAIASQQQIADVFAQTGGLPKAVDVRTFWTDALNADLARFATSTATAATSAAAPS